MILKVIYVILSFFLLTSIFFIIMIFTQKSRLSRKDKRVNEARNYFFKKYIDKEDVKAKFSPKFFLESLVDVEEQIFLEKEVRLEIIEELVNTKFVKKQIKRLDSSIKYRRFLSVFYLSKLDTKEISTLLFKRFLVEKSEAIKLSIIAQLNPENDTIILKTIMESLVGSSDIYQERLAIILGNKYRKIHLRFYQFMNEKRFEIVLAIARITEFNPGARLISYLQDLLIWVTQGKPFTDQENEILKETILKSLVRHTPESVNAKLCDDLNDDLVKTYAIRALEYNPSTKCINRIIRDFDNGPLDEVRIKTIAKICQNEPIFIESILNIFFEFNLMQKKSIVKALSERIDYIILKTYQDKKLLLEEFISLMMQEKIIEPIIYFLNKNSDLEIEDIVLSIMRNHLIDYPEITEELRVYLKIESLSKLSLQRKSYPIMVKEKPPLEKSKIIWIIKWISFAILLFPLIYIIRMNKALFSMDILSILKGFLIDVNVYLIFYFAAINLIYIILFILSLVGSTHQSNLAKIKKYSYLFYDKLLPGISIIAPAYNEELSIIDSVTSLLNLKYPNFEVVVVNDGSKDETLKKLIDYFQLERKHSMHKTSLNTKSVLGVYTCKNIPNLVVVDKQNGGKADALNTGVNISKKTYVCGIDADSILEGDALLKLASTMLDDTAPVLALGGNIYPANGFSFNRGEVEKRGIPKEILCRFQTIEYLRAFTSGRIGWSELKSLMIISGAFGLFNKNSLISSGGYLTSSGSFKKDTVGEDMELVVRLTTESLKKKESQRVAYVYNAYCYTELPSDMKTLLKQRNRWQRGLIDILSFHRNIALKPRYKQIGFIGYPYFFIFEFLGPFLELIGYLMLALALIFGLLNLTIVLGIFTVSIVFGIVISLASLFMSEKEILMMNRKETIILILYAILENFGYRQLLSLHRVSSSFNAIKESGSWGTQKRKGFKK